MLWPRACLAGCLPETSASAQTVLQRGTSLVTRLLWPGDPHLHSKPVRTSRALTAVSSVPSLLALSFFFSALSFFTYLILFIYFWLCAGSPLLYRRFSSRSEQRLLLVSVCRLLVAVASLAVEHGL